MGHGHHNIRFDGDPYALSGAWSPPTSRANFCEEDYALTFYLAEFINSLTNVAYVYYALQYMYGPGSRGLLRPNVDFMSSTLFVLGIGSFLFHASLRQALEFVDELSMMALLWSMLHAVLTVRQTPRAARALSALLAVVFLTFTAFYLRTPLIIYQVVAFLSGVGVVVARVMHLLHRARPPLPPHRCREWRRRAVGALLVCVVGYAIWNVDLECCAALRRLRARVGLPWAWLLELHGWWHVLTAIGAARFMTVAREIREEVRREEQEKKKE
ncbi:alkaline ceramidase family protein [Cordyceps fumosorosea ARSEF 2679]|uniref:Alkaline ceramidase family protein n=1 Tax=Cordyceps fumosorosea (strain ARSEF 2679) TaxID=1081104 RepID=A0A168EDH8_CORFA|nr:alkaline ceramidase family protein [Cordyceps fumosorosea ARSEF 2679]OAA73683.1 alkaline ceramidase family protein [Cordyceps fumosorosea ARSEF 2679]